MAALNVGDKAPGFKLTDQHGNTVKLSDFKGKKLLVYFYPKADTPGCTKQACSLRDENSLLAEQGMTVIGISPDKPDRQRKFDDKYTLGFSLLSDESMETARAYGAWGEKKCMGKTSEGVIRSSFVIDEKGKILALKYKINPTDTATFAVKALTAPAAPKKSQAAKSPKEVKPKPAPAPWVFQQVSQNPGNPAAFTGGTQLAAALSDLFAGQRYAVLATQREGEPYGNLVAFGVSPDLKTLLFATKRATRKYENMIADSRIAILIDNRENEIADIGKAWAVTALGKVEEAVEAEREQWVKVYLGKLPELEPFVGDQDNALMKVHVEKYIAVSGFDNIFELTPRR